MQIPAHVDQFVPLQILRYVEALKSGNLTDEGSTKDILRQIGVTEEQILDIQLEAINQIGFIIFYFQSWFYRQPVCETNDKEHMFRVINGNLHRQYVKHKKEKKVKERPDIPLDFWGAAKTPVKPVKAKTAVQTHIHPDGLDCVHLPKSATIHYSKSKKTLCGKAWDRAVKDSDKLDTLYPICSKCLAKI